MNDLTLKKNASLIAKLGAMEKAIVLYSGGVDSCFLLFSAINSLGSNNVLAVIGVSPSLPQRELNEARSFALKVGANLVEINPTEINNPAYQANSGDRCYYCKLELNNSLNNFLCKNENYRSWPILDGLQASDDVSTRPGFIANAEYSVQHPLYELGFLKEEIRDLCLQFNLSVHDKPQSACLASRIMPGSKVTEDLLKKIEMAEEILLNYGLRDFRVRIHTLPSIDWSNNSDSLTLARIELTNFEDKSILFDSGFRTKMIKDLGFDYITLDLEGYREGGFVKKKSLRVI